MTSSINYLRSKLNALWQKPSTKKFVIIAGTIIGTSAFYYPIVQKFWNPYAHMTPEQQAYFEKNSLYPIQVQKQKEQELNQTKLNKAKTE